MFVLPRNVAKRSQVTAEQRSCKEANNRVHVVGVADTANPHTARITDVSRWGRWSERKTETREGAHGSAKEQTARAASHWAWQGRTSWCERYAARRAESVQGHDTRSRCTCLHSSLCLSVALGCLCAVSCIDDERLVGRCACVGVCAGEGIRVLLRRSARFRQMATIRGADRSCFWLFSGCCGSFARGGC